MTKERKTLLKITAPDENVPASKLTVEMSDNDAETCAGLEAAMAVNAHFLKCVTEAFVSVLARLPENKVEETLTFMKGTVKIFRKLQNEIKTEPKEEPKKKIVIPINTGAKPILN